MTMVHAVASFGQPIMLHIGVALAVYHLVCPCVVIVLSVVIIQVMISICFVLKQEGHVIVETQV